jgi:hypothetical protein
MVGAAVSGKMMMSENRETSSLQRAMLSADGAARVSLGVTVVSAARRGCPHEFPATRQPGNPE